MAEFTRYFASNWTLEQTQEACEAVQQTELCRLRTVSPETRIVGTEAVLVNRADFLAKDSIHALPRLLFVVVGNQDPAILIAQKESEGWTYLSDSRIYVEGVLERVMIFGR